MIFYVYHYCDPESGIPFYVGKGKGNRAYAHLTTCNQPKHNCYGNFFYKKLRKMLSRGINPDVKIIKDQLTEDEAFDLETFEIKRIGRRNLHEGPLTNLTDGGGGSSGHITSDKTRQKISKSGLGKILSEKNQTTHRQSK